MKKQKKNMGSLIKKAGVKGMAAGAVSLVLVAGGFHVLWEDYQRGNLFKPELFVKNRELQGNQIMFPEKENIQQNGNDPGENDNKKLEHDPEAKDPYGQEKKNEAAYELANNQMEADPESARNIFSDPSFDYAGGTGGTNWAPEGQSVVLAPDAQEKVNLPAGHSGLTTEDTGNKDTPASSNGSGSDSGDTTISGGGSTGGGGGSGSNGNQDNTITPGGNDVPAPTPTPDPTPTPTPTPDQPDNGDDTPTVDPDYPDDSKQPTLPSDPSLSGGEEITLPDFPSEGLPEGDEAENAVLSIISSSDSVGELYRGAVLTDWKLLCSVYAYVDTPTGTYRLREYNDNFKIGDHPKIAEGDFTVTFYFRPNANSPWTEIEHEFSVKYCKMVVMGPEDEAGNRRTLDSVYLGEDEEICLLKELKELYTAQQNIWGMGLYDSLLQVVPGWYVNGEQEVFTDYYKPEAPGRYEIYPMDRVDIPEYFGGYLTWDFDERGNYVYRQFLHMCSEFLDEVEIPQGIQQVNFNGYVTGKIYIPESVTTLLDDFIMVTQGYEVAEGNPYFCSVDGFLYNKAKTELLGIPVGLEEIDIPEDVTRVVIPEWNSLTKINFASPTPPDINLGRISGTQLVVPAEYYADYLLTWRNSLGGNSLIPSSEETDYTYVNGAVLSSGGTVLNRISSDNSGLWIVPDTVRRIKSYAADKCPNVERLVISEGVEVLESESLNGEGLTEIYFQSDVPPEISADTFGDLDTKNLVIYVSEDNRDAYVEAWGEILGEETAENLIQVGKCELVETEAGMIYLDVAGSAVLIQAPEDITSLDELDLPDGVELTEIGNSAFKGCIDLILAELPETVTKVGRNAFSQCEKLEGVISYAPDYIYIGQDAFVGLRYMAFNTGYLDLEDPLMARDTLTYVTSACLLDETAARYAIGCGDAIVLGDTEETRPLVFGLDGDDTYLLNGTTDFSGEIQAPEGRVITYVIRGALQDCQGEFTLPAEVAEHIRAIQSAAFKNSGLTGTVEFSDDLFQIGSDAFIGCVDLTEVKFSNPASDLGDADPGLSVDPYAFARTGLTEIEFPEDLRSVGYSAFEDTDMQSITFTGENVPLLTYPGRGTFYSFGVETEGLVQLEGAAAENEDAYVDVWKYSIQGYESDDEIESNIYYTVLNAAVSEWMDAAGDFPVDEDWNYLPEFLEYVNDCTPYTIENIKFTGEERIYTLLGKEVPDHPDRLEKPDINEYVDAWRDRIEEEKNEKEEQAVVLDKIPEVLADVPVDPEVPQDPDQGNGTTQDPDEPSEDPQDPETPEKPETPTDPDAPETPEIPETPTNPDAPEEPDQPQEPENPDPSEDTDQTENESGGSMEEDKEDTEEKDASSEETLDTEENSDTEESL